MVRLWIHSPHEVMTEALSRYVASLGFRTQGDPEGASAAVFDLTLFDTDLPPAPELPTLALVRSTDAATLRDVRRLGYRGVHRPENSRSHLVASIHAITTGCWAPQNSDDDPDPEEATAPRLTARKAEVLRLLMLGFPNKRIATRLGISERTVKHFVSSLIRKHDVRGRTGLVVKRQALFAPQGGQSRASIGE
jgi:DNA-binding NarL/FixJ family response regulator